MSNARPFTLEDLQRWTEEANNDVKSNAPTDVVPKKPVALEDLLGGEEGGKVD